MTQDCLEPKLRELSLKRQGVRVKLGIHWHPWRLRPGRRLLVVREMRPLAAKSGKEQMPRKQGETDHR